jgi:hypothetical protein
MTCDTKTLHVTRQVTCVGWSRKHPVRHARHVTRHTPHVTRHTSHVTRHTPHATLPSRHTWPNIRVPMEYMLALLSPANVMQNNSRSDGRALAHCFCRLHCFIMHFSKSASHVSAADELDAGGRGGGGGGKDLWTRRKRSSRRHADRSSCGQDVTISQRLMRAVLSSNLHPTPRDNAARLC